jgi:hypothetical protein
MGVVDDRKSILYILTSVVQTDGEHSISADIRTNRSQDRNDHLTNQNQIPIDEAVCRVGIRTLRGIDTTNACYGGTNALLMRFTGSDRLVG